MMKKILREFRLFKRYVFLIGLVIPFLGVVLLVTALFNLAQAQRSQSTTPTVHDARDMSIQAPSTVNGTRSYGSPQITVWVQNEGDHEESIAVYLDAVPPGGIDNPGGCQPAGRLIEKTVLVRSGQQVPVSVQNETPFSFSCTNPEAVAGWPYTLIAAVDAHADDFGICAPGALISLACFQSLGDDDNDPWDNRLSKTIRWEQ